MQEIKHGEQDDHAVDYEKSDANLKIVLLVSLVGVVLLVFGVILVDNLFELTKQEIVYDTVLKPESIPLRDLRAREDEVLNSYKVLDSSKGVYQLPIDRAMELVADEAYQAQQQSH